VERLDLEAGHVDEPEPLVLGRPPQRARAAVVERDVDAVVANGVADGVGDGLVLVGPVVLGCVGMVEGERVPREPAAGPERRGDALERAPAVGPGRE
jgi:hypothetical protein